MKQLYAVCLILCMLFACEQPVTEQTNTNPMLTLENETTLPHFNVKTIDPDKISKQSFTITINVNENALIYWSLYDISGKNPILTGTHNVISNTDSFLTISNKLLIPGKQYSIVLIAENLNGFVSTSEKLAVTLQSNNEEPDITNPVVTPTPPIEEPDITNPVVTPTPPIEEPDITNPVVTPTPPVEEPVITNPVVTPTPPVEEPVITPNITAPEWKSGFPRIDAITQTGCKYFVAQNKTGAVYYMIVPYNSIQPTAEQIKAQLNYDSVSIVKSGIKKINTPHYEYTTSFSELKAGTEYTIYSFGETSDGIAMKTIHSVTFTTMQPAPQSWSVDKEPVVDSAMITTTSIRINCAITIPGTIYAVILPVESPSPDSSQVQQGKDSYGIDLSADCVKEYRITSDFNCNIYKSIEFTQLQPGTSYSIYLTASNTNEQCIEPVLKYIVSTAEPVITPLEWKPDFPKVDTITQTGFKYFVAQNKTGTVYFMVVPHESTPPTIEQLKAQMNYDSVTIVKCGIKEINTVNYNYTTTMSKLTANTSYDVYAIGESREGVLMGSINKVTVTTAP